MSVRKRKWRTAKGIEREAWIIAYADRAGDRHIETFVRKTDADDRHAEIKGEIKKGIHTATSKSITVDEAGRLWLESCEAAGLERATIDSYQQHINLHIVPYLGRDKLTALTTGIIRQWQHDLRAGNPAPGEKRGTKRSATMVKRLTVSLGTLLSDMAERNYVSRNVVRDLRRGRKGKDRHEQREHEQLEEGKHMPSPEEIRSLLASLQDDRWRPLLITTIYTGLRASEIRGLRWSDLKLDKAKLDVRQRADKYQTMGKPKSKKGTRTVPLPAYVVNTLREWNLKCPKGKLDLVFPTGKGGVENYSNIVKRGLIPAMIRAGLTQPVLDAEGTPVLDKRGKPMVTAKYKGLHALRHWFASWCLSRKPAGLGMTLLDVRDLMGHSTIALTADRYAHLLPRSDDAGELDAAAALLVPVRAA